MATTERNQQSPSIKSCFTFLRGLLKITNILKNIILLYLFGGIVKNSLEPIYDGNKSIEEIRSNEFWYCENREPKNKLEPQGKMEQFSFFKEGERYIVGMAGKIESFKDYRECYKKYQFPKSTIGESRKH